MSQSFMALIRIAEVLDKPVESFFKTEEEAIDERSEVAELLVAFAAISDPSVRRKCLAFVRSSAEPSFIDR